jgi:HlyD family secretion protein
MRRRTLWVNVGIGVAIAAVLGLIVVSLRPSSQAPEQRTVTVTRGDVTATVTASGTVERSGVVDLTFATPGTVTSVDVVAGDSVSAGDVVATVDDTAARQQLAAAESTLAQAVQTSASSDASVASASAALSDASRVAQQTNKRNKLAVEQAQESLAVAEDLWDESCLDPASALCPNSSAQARLRAAQASIDSAQLAVDIAARNVIDNAAKYDIAVAQASETLDQVRVQEDAACSADNTTSVCKSAQGATLAARQAYDNAVRANSTGRSVDAEAYQNASLSLASANVALQQSQAELRKAGDDAVRSARQTLDTAKRVYRQGKAAGEQSVSAARASLTSALASQETVQVSGGEELTASDAAIESAAVAVEVAQQAVNDTRLVTPVDGVIGSVPYVVGEVATASGAQGGITVLPDGPIEVVANFAESDAAKIVVGAPATITFDALAGERAEGTVVSIDPVGTTSNSGLITYGVRVQVIDAPTTVREGMTASVSVLVDEAIDVLVVPQSAVTGTDDRAAVLVQRTEGAETSTDKVQVVLGLQGDAGVEITAGVDEGDVLVIPSADDVSFPDGGVPGSESDEDPFGDGDES